MKTLLSISDAALKIVIASAIGYSMIIFASWMMGSKSNIELHYPPDAYGARIPGTNYIIDGKDTLEIVQSYHYRILDKEERKQAREYIKSLRR